MLSEAPSPTLPQITPHTSGCESGAGQGQNLWKLLYAWSQGNIPGLLIWKLTAFMKLSPPLSIWDKGEQCGYVVTVDIVTISMSHTESLN